MNALNDNNDPFEDIFRDRFADFESQPDDILWNKIEPQLPVKPSRRFPYWQISAVMLGLFLGGIYFTYKEELLTDFADNGRLPSKGSLPYLPESISKKKEYKKALLNTEVIDNQTNKYFNKYINTKTNIQEIIEENPSFVASNNFSKNPLNPTNFQQSNPKITTNSIFEPNNRNLDGLDNSSHIFDPKSLSNNTSVLERKVNLSILGTKSYGLLTNHFQTARIKFITVPKEESYFKERKSLEFYVSAMPLLNYYTITPNGNDANFVHNISVNDDGDRVGFYTQAGLVFTLSNRFKLRTGLTFTKTNHSINYRVRTDSLVIQPADNKGVDISFAELNKTYSQSANYLGTKIEVQYTFLKGEALSHYVSIGGEASYRLNGNHSLNGFANFAYGITRQIGDKAYIFIEPTFSYSLNQQSDDNSLLLVKPNKVGFNIGVNFKIK